MIFGYFATRIDLKLDLHLAVSITECLMYTLSLYLAILWSVEVLRQTRGCLTCSLLFGQTATILPLQPHPTPLTLHTYNLCYPRMSVSFFFFYSITYNHTCDGRTVRTCEGVDQQYFINIQFYKSTCQRKVTTVGYVL